MSNHSWHPHTHPVISQGFTPALKVIQSHKACFSIRYNETANSIHQLGTETPVSLFTYQHKSSSKEIRLTTIIPLTIYHPQLITGNLAVTVVPLYKPIYKNLSCWTIWTLPNEEQVIVKCMHQGTLNYRPLLGHSQSWWLENPTSAITRPHPAVGSTTIALTTTHHALPISVNLAAEDA